MEFHLGLALMSIVKKLLHKSIILYADISNNISSICSTCQINVILFLLSHLLLMQVPH